VSVPFFSITHLPTEPVVIAGSQATRPPTKYRLAVLADSAADVTRHAGGLLCDLTLSGWEVTVLVSTDQDHRGLRILGVQTLDLEYALSMSGHGPRPHATAVAGDLYRRDPRVQCGVLQALQQGVTDLMLWQAPSEPELDLLIGADVHHQPSAAATAFKGHALAALRASASDTAGNETFRSSTLVACRGLVATT
jgi:hypothetical protein